MASFLATFSLLLATYFWTASGSALFKLLYMCWSRNRIMEENKQWFEPCFPGSVLGFFNDWGLMWLSIKERGGFCFSFAAKKLTKNVFRLQSKAIVSSLSDRNTQWVTPSLECLWWHLWKIRNLQRVAESWSPLIKAHRKKDLIF